MSGLSESERRFVLRMGQLFESAGLAPSVGQVFGYLLIAEPETQSLEAIAEALGLSKASVSNATRLLAHYGVLERESRPGERRVYCRVADDPWEQSARRDLAFFQGALALAEAGMADLATTPSRKARLASMVRAYRFFAREIEAMIEKWRRER